MNSTTSSSTRLACRVVRLWSALAHDGVGSGTHVDTCPACREYFANTATFDKALRQDAARVAFVSTDNLEDRIMREVRNSAPQQRHTARRPVAGYAMLGSLAAIAAVVFMSFRTNSGGDAQPSVANGAEISAEAAQLADAVRQLPEGIRSLEQPAARLTQNNPLQREVQNVYADAQSALAFLKMNFMPGTTAAAGQPSST